MVKHIVLWKLKEELSTEEKNRVKRELKEALEGLKNRIKEIVELKVNVAAGKEKIRPFMAERICYDYEF